MAKRANGSKTATRSRSPVGAKATAIASALAKSAGRSYLPRRRSKRPKISQTVAEDHGSACVVSGGQQRIAHGCFAKLTRPRIDNINTQPMIPNGDMNDRCFQKIENRCDRCATTPENFVGNKARNERTDGRHKRN